MTIRRILPSLYIAAVFLLMLLIILYPDRYVYASSEGILIFAKSVLPALLPFMFITAILTRTGGVNKLSKTFAPVTKVLFNQKGLSAYVYLISILSGYPVGSKTIADLYEGGQITSSQATKMSTFCSTSGPLFIIGSIGAGMLGNKKIGFLLYITHIVSGLICGILFRGIKTQEKSSLLPPKKASVDNVLGDAMLASVTTILCVGGFITVFFMLAKILTDFKVIYPLSKLISLILTPFTKDARVGEYAAQGLIELTRGCHLLSALTGDLILPIISFLIAFGGLSIIIQQLVFLKAAKVNIKIFLFSKLVHAVLAFGICFLFMYLFF